MTTLAELEELARGLQTICELLHHDDPDANQVTAALGTLATVEATCDGLVPDTDPETLRVVVQRIVTLHTEALVAAQAHRERLAQALVQLDRNVQAMRQYETTPTHSGHFIDQQR